MLPIQFAESIAKVYLLILICNEILFSSINIFNATAGTTVLF